MTILITTVTKGSYSITGRACNLILPELSSTTLLSIYGYDLPLLDGKLKIPLHNFGDVTS
jgi:hypothetical protein